MGGVQQCGKEEVLIDFGAFVRLVPERERRAGLSMLVSELSPSCFGPMLRDAKPRTGRVLDILGAVHRAGSAEHQTGRSKCPPPAVRAEPFAPDARPFIRQSELLFRWNAVGVQRPVPGMPSSIGELVTDSTGCPTVIKL